MTDKWMVKGAPNLGLATTRQLFEELQARGEVAQAQQGSFSVSWSLLREDAQQLTSLARAGLKILLPSTLDYRTVDGKDI